MSAIGSTTNNNINPLYDANYDVQDASTPQAKSTATDTAAVATPTAQENKDTMEGPAPRTSILAMPSLATALANPTGAISATSGPISSDKNSFDEKLFNNWVKQNFPQSKDAEKPAWLAFAMEKGHSLDEKVYTILFNINENLILEQMGVKDIDHSADPASLFKELTKSNDLKKSYALNQFNAEEHLVAYTTGNSFKVVNFVKGPEGKWGLVKEDGSVKELPTKDFNAAVSQGLTGAKNFWVVNKNDEGQTYVEKRVHTPNGNKITGMINGTTDLTKGGKTLFSTKNGTSLKVNGSTEHVEASFTLAKDWHLDTQYIFSGNRISQLDGKMGDLNGSIFAFGRYDISKDLQVSLGYGYMPKVGNGTNMISAGMHYKSDVVKKSWLSDNLKLTSTLEGNVALPMMISGGKVESGADFLQDAQMTAQSYTKLEAVLGDLKLSGGYAISLDFAQALTNITMSDVDHISNFHEAMSYTGISQYAELGLAYQTSKASLKGNIYMPISIHDGNMKDDFIWSLSGSYNFESGVKASFGVSGSFDKTDANANIDAEIAYKNNAIKLQAYNLSTQAKDSGLRITFQHKF